MAVRSIPEDERLATLRALGLLDTPPEERFDRITRLASMSLRVPVALVTLVDAHRLWLKSAQGIDVREIPREGAFCSVAIGGDDMLVVEDAAADARFACTPLVTGAPHVRFYAGQPLRAPDGTPLGTLCVVDTQPRTLSAAERSALRDFARLAEEEIAKSDLALHAQQRDSDLQEMAARFEATFENVAVGMAHVGLDGAWLRVNPAMCLTFGYEAHEFHALTAADLTLAEDRARDDGLREELLSGRRYTYATEQRFVRKSGGVFWGAMTVSLVQKPDGSPDYLIVVVDNIQARKDAEWTLQRLNNELEARIAERTQELQVMNAELALEIVQRRRAEAGLRASELRIRTIVDGSLDAFIGTDAQGIVTDWNRAAERIFGWSAEEAIGRDLGATILPAERDEARHAGLQRYLGDGSGPVLNRRIELPARTRAGERIPVEMTISAYEVDGAPFFGATLHDISERTATARRLDEQRQMLNAVLETVDVAVVACSADGRITVFNRAARDFHGIDAEEIEPGNWSARYDLHAADGSRLLERDEVPLYRALQGEVVKDVEMMIRPPGRTPRVVLASGRPLPGADGRPLGAVVAMKDITAFRQSERRIADSERRLRGIAENLPTLIGQIDAAQRFVYLNSRAALLFGRPVRELIGLTVREAYGDAEYARVQPYVERVLAGDKVMFEDEVTVLGERRHYQAAYIPETADNGEVRGFFAMAFDITDRKNGELRQAESERLLRTITDNLPALISYIGTDRRYKFSNSTYRRWFGRTPEEMPDPTVAALLGEEQYAQIAGYLDRALAGERVTFDFPLTDAGGRTRYTEATYIPDRGPDGTVHGIYTMVMDVTQRTLMEQKFYRQATHDALTGLPNRSEMISRLEQAVRRVRRSGHELAVLFLDIDGFKSVNDTFGHHVGDDVLRLFAERVSGAVRESDVVARWAGDEFLVMLEGTAAARQSAHAVATKILQSLEEPMSCGGTARRIGTSIGIAIYRGGEATADELVSRADTAMYAAKRGGKNRYVVAEAA